MDPTFDQIEQLIDLATDIHDRLLAIEVAVVTTAGHVAYIAKLLLAASGLTIGALTWRNFVLAKNQRHLL